MEHRQVRDGCGRRHARPYDIGVRAPTADQAEYMCGDVGELAALA